MTYPIHRHHNLSNDNYYRVVEDQVDIALYYI